MKKYLQFPELLLLIAILITHLFGRASTMDVHIGDTYYVIDGHSSAGYLVFLPLYLVLFISWIFHLLLRQRGVDGGVWAQLQVGVSVGSLIFIVCGSALPGFFYPARPRRYMDYSTWNEVHSYRPLYLAILIVAAVFILAQLLFWITAAVVLIRKRGRMSI